MLDKLESLLIVTIKVLLVIDGRRIVLEIGVCLPMEGKNVIFLLGKILYACVTLRVNQTVPGEEKLNDSVVGLVESS